MTADVAQQVGANVRAEMSRRGVIQREVAEALGLSQPQVSERLLGRIPWNVVELDVVARLLGVPISTFLPENEPVS